MAKFEDFATACVVSWFVYKKPREKAQKLKDSKIKKELFLPTK